MYQWLPFPSNFQIIIDNSEKYGLQRKKLCEAGAIQLALLLSIKKPILSCHLSQYIGGFRENLSSTCNQTLKNPSLARNTCGRRHSKHTPQALQQHPGTSLSTPPPRSRPATPTPSQLPELCNTQARRSGPTRTSFSTRPSGAPRPPPPPRASPGQSQVRVGLLSMRGRRVFQSLQQRREGARTRGRHVGHPAARTGRGENPVTAANRPAGAQGSPGPGPARPPRPRRRAASAPQAPCAHPQQPNLHRRRATRTQAHAALGQARSRHHFPGQLSTGGGDRRGAGEARGARHLAARGRRLHQTDGSRGLAP